MCNIHCVLGPLEPVNVLFVIRDRVGFVTWSEPTNYDTKGCNGSYEITLGDKVVKTDNQYHVFHDLEYCSELTVKIRTIAHDLRTSQIVEVTNATSVPQIKDASSERGVVTWTVNQYARLCKYQIKVNDKVAEANYNATQWTVNEPYEPINPEGNTEFECTDASKKNVTITGVHQNGDLGEPTTIQVMKPPGKLRFFKVTDEAGGVKASWEEKFKFCTIMVQVDELQNNYTNATTTTFDGKSFKPCVAYKVSAIAIDSDGIPGVATIVKFTTKVNWDKINFTLEGIDQNVTAFWSEPPTNCSMLLTVIPGYEIYKDIVSGVDLDKTHYEYCTEYKIVASLTDSEGEEISSKEFIYTRDPVSRFEAINNLTMKVKKLNKKKWVAMLSWEATCPLNYYVGCKLDKHGPKYDKISAKGHATYEFKRCKMQEANKAMILTILPHYFNRLMGREIKCIYDVVLDSKPLLHENLEVANNKCPLRA